jgi:Fic family protein
MNYQNRIPQIDTLNREIAAFRPLSEPILSQIKEYFRIGLTYSSNALEGNTLTETETKIVLEEGLTVAGKPLRDHYEASGHSEAYELVLSLAINHGFTEEEICAIHELFFYRIDRENAGRYRKVPVIITGTEYIPPAPADVAERMKEFVASLPELKKNHHPVEFSALVHLGLVNIHPFIDGNGRTARLLMNLALMQAGYVITIIPPILRSDYITLVKAAQLEKGLRERDFINFISAMVFESTSDYFRLLRAVSG